MDVDGTAAVGHLIVAGSRRAARRTGWVTPVRWSVQWGVVDGAAPDRMTEGRSGGEACGGRAGADVGGA